MDKVKFVSWIALLCTFGFISKLNSATVDSISITGDMPAVKGSDIQLVCTISQFSSSSLVEIYKSDTSLPSSLAGISSLTSCVASICLTGLIDRYRFRADSSKIYINITSLQRTNDEKYWACASANQRKQLQLIVYTVPQTLQFDNPPSQDQDIANNAVTLKCSTGCIHPTPSFTWYYIEAGGSRQVWSTSVSATDKPGTCPDSERIYSSVLSLVRYTTFQGNVEKTVKFVCGILSFPGMTQSLFTSSSVNVLFAASPESPPRIHDIKNGMLKIIENTQGVLVCSTEGGNPLATLSWNCFSNGSPSVTVNKTVTRTVTWNALRNTDQTCTCQSTHPVAGTQSVSVRVEILYPPTKPSFKIKSSAVSSTINVIGGNPLSVSCESSANPVPSYKWTLPSSAITKDPDLSVASVQSNGIYTCDVQNSMIPSNGTVVTGSNSSSINVQLLYPPSTITFNYGSTSAPSISSLNVIQHDTFSVACTSDGEPAPVYEWNNLGSNRILTVNKIAADQIYTCTASNTMKETVGQTRPGSTSATLTVNVQYPPRNVSIKYHYGQSSEVGITSLSIIEGNSSTVKCSSDSKPTPSYSWSGKVTSQSESLIIARTHRITHAGTYTCTVENTMIRSFANPQKEVNGTNNPPKIEDLRNQSAVEGDSLTISCPVTVGKPPETTYQWKRTANDKTWQSQTFTINNISRNDAMFYTCKVYNTMKQTGEMAVSIQDTGAFYLNVWYSTSLTEFFINGHKGKTTITINETDTVSFECIVDSNPGSTVSIMYQQSTKLSMGGTKTLKYEIPSVMCTERGTYSCLGFNQYNKDNSSKILNLLVNCSPRPSPLITLEENVTSALQIPAVLTFTTLAYPEPEEDDFRWFRWNTSAWLELSTSDEFRVETAALQSNLTVIDVNRAYFGTYKLEVKNTIGSHEEIFHLIPEDKPDPPTGFRHLENTITKSSFTVQWTPGFDNGLDQTFVLRYRKVTENVWNSIEIADTGVSTMNYKIANLSSGTEYDVVLHASNRLGNSTETETLRIKTRGAKETTKLTSTIGGAVGGSIGGILIISTVAAGYFIIKRVRISKLRTEVEEETQSVGLSSEYMDLQPTRGYINTAQVYAELHTSQSTDSQLKSGESEYISIKTNDKNQPEHDCKNKDRSLCQEEQFKVYENLKIGGGISSASKQH